MYVALNESKIASELKAAQKQNFGALPVLRRAGAVALFLVATLTLLMLPAKAGDFITVVGGEQMFPQKDIIDNAVNSKDHTTLVAAVKAAGLVDTLKSEGPFTVFAPTNDAFENLPEGTVETLLKPENKGTLTTVLTYHVLPGALDLMALRKAIVSGGAKARLKTVAGEVLTFNSNGHNLSISDGKGQTANIVIYDVYQSNGVIHVIDTVLLPE